MYSLWPKQSFNSDKTLIFRLIRFSFFLAATYCFSYETKIDFHLCTLLRFLRVPLGIERTNKIETMSYFLTARNDDRTTFLCLLSNKIRLYKNL